MSPQPFSLALSAARASTRKPAKRGRKSGNARERAQRVRANKALAIQRKTGKSWTAATRAAGTTPATANRYVGSTVTKSGRRYSVASSDRLVRRKKIVTNTGERFIDVRGSRQAELLEAHREALRRFRAGDVDALQPFEGVSVGGYELLTDPDEIEDLMRRGELDLSGKVSL